MALSCSSSAALEELDEVGLNAVSTRWLAQRSGVEQPSLYWHFHSKDELLAAMAEAAIAPHARGPDSASSPLDSLTTGLMAPPTCSHRQRSPTDRPSRGPREPSPASPGRPSAVGPAYERLDVARELATPPGSTGLAQAAEDPARQASSR